MVEQWVVDPVPERDVEIWAVAAWWEEEGK